MITLIGDATHAEKPVPELLYVGPLDAHRWTEQNGWSSRWNQLKWVGRL